MVVGHITLATRLGRSGSQIVAAWRSIEAVVEVCNQWKYWLSPTIVEQ